MTINRSVDTLKITLGADPERFVMDARTRAVIPVCGWLGGTKHAPEQLYSSLGKIVKGYKVQEDNIMAEYNIPPAQGIREFIQNIHTGEQLLQERIYKENPEYILYPYNYARLRRSVLAQHEGALTFGCSPEFDAYEEGAECERVSSDALIVADTVEWPDPEEMRYAGGHLHLGITSKGKYAADIPHYVFAAFCDASIGLRSLRYDRQGGRRKLYGQAGRYRPTKYGIEYRVLSNYWVTSFERTSVVAEHAFTLMATLANNTVAYVQNLFDEIPWMEVREAINTENYIVGDELFNYIWSDLHRKAA